MYPLINLCLNYNKLGEFMKKVLILFALIIPLANTSFGQVNSNYDGPKPEVMRGAKSFMFMYTPFQSNFNPVYVSTVSVFPDESMNLFGAGFRYFLTGNIALGVGLNFGSGSSEAENAAGDKFETSATTFGVAVEGNYHFMPLYSVSPYVGVNVNFGSYSLTEDETPAGGSTITDEWNGSGLGAAVHLGFDWFFTEGLSLGGRYSFGFQSLSSPEFKSGNTTVEGASSSFIGIGSASVILNVHF
jgi:hypothetical protein